MKGLWMFVSYCEAYYEDSYLVKRAHLNLYLIIEIFQNVIDNAVLARHKQSFKQQRQSMLPAKTSCTSSEIVALPGLSANADASDFADYSLGVHSELSITDRDSKVTQNLQQRLEEAYIELEQQIHQNGRHLLVSSGDGMSVQGEALDIESSDCV